jgi:hypothetical protein
VGQTFEKSSMSWFANVGAKMCVAPYMAHWHKALSNRSTLAPLPEPNTNTNKVML